MEHFKMYFSLCEWEIGFFFFSWLIWWIILIDFQIPKLLHKPGINPTWLRCAIIFIRCWIRFDDAFLRNSVHEGCWSYFSFLAMSVSGFDIRVILASQSELGSVFSTSIFWRKLWGIGITFILNV